MGRKIQGTNKEQKKGSDSLVFFFFLPKLCLLLCSLHVHPPSLASLFALFVECCVARGWFCCTLVSLRTWSDVSCTAQVLVSFLRGEG